MRILLSILISLAFLAGFTSCDSENSNGTNQIAFEYQLPQDTVKYSQNTQVDLSYSGISFGTDSKVRIAQIWKKNNDGFLIELHTEAIKVEQSIPFGGEGALNSFDSENPKGPDQLNEQELIMQEELMRVLEQSTMIQMDNQGAGFSTDTTREGDQYVLNPLLFPKLPGISKPKKGDSWKQNVSMRTGLPTQAAVKYEVIELNGVIVKLKFTATAEVDKENEMAAMLGIVDIEGNMEGELLFNMEKGRVESGFYNSVSICDMIQMNKPMQMDVEIKQQFAEILPL